MVVPVSDSIQILEEIKKILASEPNKDSDCISLYNLHAVIKKNFNRYFSYVINLDNEYCDLIFVEIVNEQDLKISYFYNDGQESVVFSKNDGDLYLKYGNSYHGQMLLEKYGQFLSKTYDQLLYLHNVIYQDLHYLSPINSNFKVILFHTEICLRYKQLKIILDNKNYLSCNSNNVIQSVKNHEWEIASKIFVKISDCPQFAQQELYQIRQEQMKEIAKEEKKAKRKAFFRNLWPF